MDLAVSTVARHLLLAASPPKTEAEPRPADGSTLVVPQPHRADMPRRMARKAFAEITDRASMLHAATQPPVLMVVSAAAAGHSAAATVRSPAADLAAAAARSPVVAVDIPSAEGAATLAEADTAEVAGKSIGWAVSRLMAHARHPVAPLINSGDHSSVHPTLTSEIRIVNLLPGSLEVKNLK